MESKDSTYNYICAGYLVKDGKVLLVLHNIFHKWVPPGGHVDPDETFAEAAEREFTEETGLNVKAISSAPTIHPKDDNATPLALPFYTDVMLEGFRKPTIGQYFYFKQVGNSELKYDSKELDDARWFGIEELAALETFDQVRSVAAYAIRNYPSK